MTTTCVNALRPNLGAFGYTTATGDGSTQSYTIGYDYPYKSTTSAGDLVPYLKCYVAGVLVTAVTMTSNNVVHFTTAPANTALIEIIRESSLAATLIDWSNASDLTAENSQIENTQHQFLIQEMYNRLRGLSCQVDQVVSGNGSATEYTFTGDASTTDFSLNPESLLTAAQCFVFMNGIRQRIVTYSIVETAGYSHLVMATAPATGIAISVVVVDALLANYILGDGSVTSTKIADGAVTFDKIDFDSEGTDGQVLFKRSGSATFDDISYTDISDLATGVELVKPNDMALCDDDFNVNGNKIINLTAGTDNNDATNLGQVQDLIDAFVPDPVTIYAVGDATLSSGGTSTVTVNVAFQPTWVIIYWKSVGWGAGNFTNGTAVYKSATVSTPETQYLLRGKSGSTNVYVITTSLQLTTTGFIYNVGGDGLAFAAGDISYVAFV